MHPSSPVVHLRTGISIVSPVIPTEVSPACRFSDMATEAAPAIEYHHSGLYTQMLMSFLEQELSAAATAEVLKNAGEVRGVEELKNIASWSSYHQFRRLLEEVRATLGPISESDGSYQGLRLANADIAESMQNLGSPGAVLSTGDGTNPLMPMRRYEMTEVGQTEWTIGEWFIDGFEPYPEFCAFVAGQYGMIPMFFGLPAAEVVEEECQCRGDAACSSECAGRRSTSRPHGSRPRGAKAAARGPPGAVASDDHRPRLQRALRGRPPGNRQIRHAEPSAPAARCWRSKRGPGALERSIPKG